MSHSDQPQPSIWPRIGFIAVRWLSLTGLLAMFVLIVSGGDNPPELAQSGNRQDEIRFSPFSLDALHQRLPPKAIERVRHFVKYYRRNRRRGLEDAISRSTKYLGSYKKIFRDAGLPEDLAYLPLIESGFLEHAVSPAQAVGVWQFIEETGLRYNLKTSRWFDQKRDPIHSARAAAKYLGHLYRKFGAWELALAAYNAGEGSVYRAMRANEKADLPTDYWSLDLKDETKNYVPAFLGAMLIAKNPPAYGLTRIEFEPPFAFEQMKVKPGTPLWMVAEKYRLDVDQLFALNPELVAGVTPPGKKKYVLRIPSGSLDKVATVVD